MIYINLINQMLCVIVNTRQFMFILTIVSTSALTVHAHFPSIHVFSAFQR